MKTIALLLLSIVTLGFSVQAADTSEHGKVAGTYEIIICKSNCSFSDPSNVFATTVVVLFDRAMSQEDMSRLDPFYHYDPSDVRACYAVDLKAHAQSYVGINKTGVSPWELTGNKIRFDLFHSPDAGYAVDIEHTGELMTGTGRSWGAGMGAPPPDFGPDVIVGRRLGPPNISACKAKAS